MILYQVVHLTSCGKVMVYTEAYSHKSSKCRSINKVSTKDRQEDRNILHTDYRVMHIINLKHILNATIFVA